MEALYVGVVDKDKNSDYGIMFPDFLGCISAGSTIRETFEMGKEALQMHIEAMVEDGDPIPEPTDLEKIQEDPEYSGAFNFLYIPVDIPELNTKRVNITIPEFFLNRIDRYTKMRGKTRSGLIVDAANEYMSRHA